jgi:hypothetical protein
MWSPFVTLHRSGSITEIPYLVPETLNMFPDRVRVALRREVYRRSVRLGDEPLQTQTSNFIFQLNTCGYSPYVTSSLTRGWVCRLQLLLVLASAVTLRSESRSTHDHILLPQIRDSPNLQGQVLVFTSTRNWVPFSSPPTTHRATVEVFDPASTRYIFTDYES